MKRYFKPEVVMSIHGYKSKGRWQDLLSVCIEEEGLVSVPYKYGYKILRILPHHIRKDVEKFRDWYFSVTENPKYGLKISQPFHRPSIIAHSLGTWIVAKALIKYPEIKFDKIFLFGSIIPESFDWFKLILNDQVNSVIYKKAEKDSIAPLGWIFTGSFRPCGTKGFIQKSSFLKEVSRTQFGHSDFNYKAHFKEYIINHLNVTPHQLSIVPGRTLTERKVKHYFVDSGRIDLQWYPEEYTTNEISINKAVEWFRIEKDIWSFAINSYSQTILGYINAMPVNDNAYNKFRTGSLLEKNLSAEDIQDYETSSSYNLIILSIAIKKNILSEESIIIKGRIAEFLIMSFIYKINQHMLGRKKIKRMLAFAWSAEGKKLCQGFCMSDVTNSEHPFPLYELDFSKFSSSQIKDPNFMSLWWYRRILKV